MHLRMVTPYKDGIRSGLRQFNAYLKVRSAGFNHVLYVAFNEISFFENNTDNIDFGERFKFLVLILKRSSTTKV